MYFFGGGTTEPAITREIIETELMDKYHWLPQDIAKISYKKMQKLLLINKHKTDAINTKQKMEKVKRDFYATTGNTSARGQGRRFTREV